MAVLGAAGKLLRYGGLAYGIHVTGTDWARAPLLGAEYGGSAGRPRWLGVRLAKRVSGARVVWLVGLPRTILPALCCTVEGGIVRVPVTRFVCSRIGYPSPTVRELNVTRWAGYRHSCPGVSPELGRKLFS